jgi:hypothetical protein
MLMKRKVLTRYICLHHTSFNNILYILKYILIPFVNTLHYLLHFIANDIHEQIFSKQTGENAAPDRFTQEVQEVDMQPIIHTSELRQLRTDLASRVKNRSSPLPWHPIVPVLRDPTLPAVQIPVEFPQSMSKLRELNEQQSANCLAYYGLPQHGTTDEKKARLAAYLGAQHAF